jgi:hypothetical protein
VNTVMNFRAASHEVFSSMDVVTSKLEVIVPCISRSILARFGGSSWEGICYA